MASDLWPEDIPIWIDGTHKWMTGLTRRTTCDDVIYALLYARGQLDTDSTDNYAVFERWRAVERPLQGRTKIVKVWTAWGPEQPDVQLLVQRLDDYFIPPPEGATRTRRRHRRSHRQRARLTHCRCAAAGRTPCGRCGGQSGASSSNRSSRAQEQLTRLTTRQQARLQELQRRQRDTDLAIAQHESRQHARRAMRDGEDYVQDSYLFHHQRGVGGGGGGGSHSDSSCGTEDSLDSLLLAVGEGDLDEYLALCQSLHDVTQRLEEVRAAQRSLAQDVVESQLGVVAGIDPRQRSRDVEVDVARCGGDGSRNLGGCGDGSRHSGGCGDSLGHQGSCGDTSRHQGGRGDDSGHHPGDDRDTPRLHGGCHDSSGYQGGCGESPGYPGGCGGSPGHPGGFGDGVGYQEGCGDTSGHPGGRGDTTGHRGGCINTSGHPGDRGDTAGHRGGCPNTSGHPGGCGDTWRHPGGRRGDGSELELEALHVEMTRAVASSVLQQQQQVEVARETRLWERRIAERSRQIRQLTDLLQLDTTGGQEKGGEEGGEARGEASGGEAGGGAGGEEAGWGVGVHPSLAPSLDTKSNWGLVVTESGGIETTSPGAGREGSLASLDTKKKWGLGVTERRSNGGIESIETTSPGAGREDSLPSLDTKNWGLVVTESQSKNGGIKSIETTTAPSAGLDGVIRWSKAGQNEAGDHNTEMTFDKERPNIERSVSSIPAKRLPAYYYHIKTDMDYLDFHDSEHHETSQQGLSLEQKPLPVCQEDDRLHRQTRTFPKEESVNHNNNPLYHHSCEASDRNVSNRDHTHPRIRSLSSGTDQHNKPPCPQPRSYNGCLNTANPKTWKPRSFSDSESHHSASHSQYHATGQPTSRSLANPAWNAETSCCGVGTSHEQNRFENKLQTQPESSVSEKDTEFSTRVISEDYILGHRNHGYNTPNHDSSRGRVKESKRSVMEVQGLTTVSQRSATEWRGDETDTQRRMTSRESGMGYLPDTGTATGYLPGTGAATGYNLPDASCYPRFAGGPFDLSSPSSPSSSSKDDSGLASSDSSTDSGLLLFHAVEGQPASHASPERGWSADRNPESCLDVSLSYGEDGLSKTRVVHEDSRYRGVSQRKPDKDSVGYRVPDPMVCGRLPPSHLGSSSDDLGVHQRMSRGSDWGDDMSNHKKLETFMFERERLSANKPDPTFSSLVLKDESCVSRANGLNKVACSKTSQGVAPLIPTYMGSGTYSELPLDPFLAAKSGLSHQRTHYDASNDSKPAAHAQKHDEVIPDESDKMLKWSQSSAVINDVPAVTATNGQSPAPRPMSIISSGKSKDRPGSNSALWHAKTVRFADNMTSWAWCARHDDDSEGDDDASNSDDAGLSSFGGDEGLVTLV